MILPGNTIGVLGGGQLGRMFAHAAQQLGYRVHVYEPTPGGPAGEVAAAQVNRPYEDVAALRAFAQQCAVVTYEFENIPVEPLAEIARVVPLRPGAAVLEVCQNRRREKRWLRAQGFPHVAFAEVDAGGDLSAAARAVGLPCVVKTADFGYDGKGQRKVTDEASLAAAALAFSGQRCVVEQFVDFATELSVIVARSTSGEVRVFPVTENIHTHHILDVSLVPARVSAEVLAQAAELGRTIAERLDVVGLLAVELFLTRAGALLVNELAPRPHNSGHWTLDACQTSQFAQHVRSICGLPLGDVSLLASVAMVNILGDAWSWQDGQAVGEPDWAAILRHPRARLHLYGKRDPRPGRKMGHYTVTGDSMEGIVKSIPLF